jgi:hypothetical protein
MAEGESITTQSLEDRPPLEQAVHSQSPEGLEQAAQDPGLTEDFALALLKHSELPSSAIESLSKNGGLVKRRKVRLGMVCHPRTPRHITLPLLRQIYTFDLMHVALTPVVPADVKKAAEEALVTRLPTISSGEKLTLARRASGRIAEQLLLEKEARVMEGALENSRLTEASIVRVLMRTEVSAVLVHAICHHAKWSQRREVRIALLRNEKTPLARALEFAASVTPATLREVLRSSRLPATIKSTLIRSKAGEESTKLTQRKEL